MNLEKLGKQIEFLNGQILATQIAVRELILTHPDPEHAARRVAHALESLAANGLASAHTNEQTLAGLQSAKNYLLPMKHQLDQALRGDA